MARKQTKRTVKKTTAKKTKAKRTSKKTAKPQKRLRIDPSERQICQELEEIRKAAGGVLRPEDTVEFARNPATELHDRFEWKDSKAAHQYRLEQARRIIRAVAQITDVGDGKPREIRVYASLVEDRKKGESYRRTDELLASKVTRDILLDQAQTELRAVRSRYITLQELGAIWEAIEKLAS